MNERILVWSNEDCPDFWGFAQEIFDGLETPCDYLVQTGRETTVLIQNGEEREIQQNEMDAVLQEYPGRILSLCDGNIPNPFLDGPPSNVTCDEFVRSCFAVGIPPHLILFVSSHSASEIRERVADIPDSEAIEFFDKSNAYCGPLQKKIPTMITAIEEALDEH